MSSKSPFQSLSITVQGGPPWGFSITGGLDYNAELLVSKIESGGAADRAGLKVEDRVVSINGVSVNRRDKAVRYVQESGHILKITIVRCLDPAGLQFSQSDATLLRNQANSTSGNRSNSGRFDHGPTQSSKPSVPPHISQSYPRRVGLSDETNIISQQLSSSILQLQRRHLTLPSPPPPLPPKSNHPISSTASLRHSSINSDYSNSQDPTVINISRYSQRAPNCHTMLPSSSTSSDSTAHRSLIPTQKKSVSQSSSHYLTQSFPTSGLSHELHAQKSSTMTSQSSYDKSSYLSSNEITPYHIRNQLSDPVSMEGTETFSRSLSHSTSVPDWSPYSTSLLSVSTVPLASSTQSSSSHSPNGVDPELRHVKERSSTIQIPSNDSKNIRPTDVSLFLDNLHQLSFKQPLTSDNTVSMSRKPSGSDVPPALPPKRAHVSPSSNNSHFFPPHPHHQSPTASKPPSPLQRHPPTSPKDSIHSPTIPDQNQQSYASQLRQKQYAIINPTGSTNRKTLSSQQSRRPPVLTLFQRQNRQDIPPPLPPRSTTPRNTSQDFYSSLKVTSRSLTSLYPEPESPTISRKQIQLESPHSTHKQIPVESPRQNRKDILLALPRVARKEMRAPPAYNEETLRPSGTIAKPRSPHLKNRWDGGVLSKLSPRHTALCGSLPSLSSDTSQSDQEVIPKRLPKSSATAKKEEAKPTEFHPDSYINVRPNIRRGYGGEYKRQHSNTSVASLSASTDNLSPSPRPSLDNTSLHTPSPKHSIGNRTTSPHPSHQTDSQSSFFPPTSTQSSFPTSPLARQESHSSSSSTTDLSEVPQNGSSVAPLVSSQSNPPTPDVDIQSANPPLPSSTVLPSPTPPPPQLNNTSKQQSDTNINMDTKRCSTASSDQSSCHDNGRTASPLLQNGHEDSSPTVPFQELMAIDWFEVLTCHYDNETESRILELAARISEPRLSCLLQCEGKGFEKYLMEALVQSQETGNIKEEEKHKRLSTSSGYKSRENSLTCNREEESQVRKLLIESIRERIEIRRQTLNRIQSRHKDITVDGEEIRDLLASLSTSGVSSVSKFDRLRANLSAVYKLLSQLSRRLASADDKLESLQNEAALGTGHSELKSDIKRAEDQREALLNQMREAQKLHTSVGQNQVSLAETLHSVLTETQLQNFVRFVKDISSSLIQSQILEAKMKDDDDLLQMVMDSVSQ